MRQGVVINAPVRSECPAKPTGQPRAIGRASVSSKPLGARSVLDGFRQSGSMKIVYPRGVGSELQAVVVNTAGGVTGGDAFSLDVRAGGGTTLSVTTQAAERAYRAARGDGAGRIDNRLMVEAGGRLNWLPQETILYDGCHLSRNLRISLSGEARLLAVEPLVFGRAAMGERLTQGRFTDRIEIDRDGRPLILDAIRLHGDIDAHLARKTVCDGAGAMATLVYIAPDAQAQLASVRGMLNPVQGGASLVHPDVMLLRALALDSFVLRKALIPILTRLSGGALPRPWMI